jgi:hypothetical protein
MYKAGTTCSLLCLLGPKGFGKTTAMLQLMKDRKNDKDMFIDLASLSPTEEFSVESDCSTLFIDNAQLYNRAIIAPKMLRKTFVVAAFSPGVRCTAALHVLIKSCGDGKDASFFFRPFAYIEALEFLSTFGFTIENSNNFESKTITERQFNWLYYITNGIPRYMEWYLQENFDIKRMFRSLSRQYEQAETKESRENIPLSDEVIDQNIIALVVSNQTDESNPAVKLGLAYCIDNSGNSLYKPASLYYAHRAFQRCKKICFGLPWQKCETLTQLLISATTCEVVSVNGKKALPQATNLVYQQNIGDICDSQETRNVVTLFVLAEKHNVVDFILYDRRPAKADVFFIQTSSQNYNNKKKKNKGMSACKTVQAKKDSTVKSQLPISQHYTQFVMDHNFVYVYATTDKTKWESHTEVYFFDLLKFNPSMYPSMYIPEE